MRRNILVLGLCEALFACYLSVGFTLISLVGQNLAPDKSWATLPFSLTIVASAIATVWASLLMDRIGRRPGFIIGAAIGGVGGGIAAWSIFAGSFAGFCVGNFLMGMYKAFAQYYRFAASEAAPPEQRSTAISLVLAGGVLAAVAGPRIAALSRDLLAPAMFAGSFAAVTVMAILSIALLTFLDIPQPPRRAAGDTGRPLSVIMKTPTFIVAAAAGSVGYSVMGFVMSATPLAVLGCSYTVGNAATVIQWHLLGMFAPSFVTGKLCSRFGTMRVIAAGCLLSFASAAVNLSSIALPAFWAGLLLSGVGWNFMYLGSTVLLTECYRSEERAKVQAANEFIMFATLSVAVFMAGRVYNSYGWDVINFLGVPFVAVILGSLVWLGARRKVEVGVPAQSGLQFP
jgi:MFS family permease